MNDGVSEWSVQHTSIIGFPLPAPSLLNALMGPLQGASQDPRGAASVSLSRHKGRAAGWQWSLEGGGPLCGAGWCDSGRPGLMMIARPGRSGIVAWRQRGSPSQRPLLRHSGGPREQPTPATASAVTHTTPHHTAAHRRHAPTHTHSHADVHTQVHTHMHTLKWVHKETCLSCTSPPYLQTYAYLTNELSVLSTPVIWLSPTY